MTVVVTGDDVVREMNARYRNVDQVTDVLAFPTGQSSDAFVEAPGAEQYLGDVIIAYPRAAAQAEAAGHSPSEELRLLTVHGCLHLAGFDHTTPSEEAVMWAHQRQILVALPGPPQTAGQGRAGPGTSQTPGLRPTVSQTSSKWRSDLLSSFRNAFAGLAYFLRTQRNGRIQLVMGLLAVALAALLQLSRSEWAVLALTIGFVLVAEMFNSVAEAAVDAVTLEYHPLAKATKDIAAGAVVLAAVIAVIVGLLLFGPRLWALAQAIR
jgi:rRNA maturation RNase YbeY